MDSQHKLRTILKIDAVLTGLTGLLMAVGAWWLDDLMELPRTLLWVAGAVLIVYVMGLIGIVRQNPINTAYVEIAVGITLVWAVGCLTIVLTDWTSVNAIGVGFLLLQVVGVIVISFLQINAIRSGSRSVSASGVTQVSPR